jgi:hypothetical protein
MDVEHAPRIPHLPILLRDAYCCGKAGIGRRSFCAAGFPSNIAAA